MLRERRRHYRRRINLPLVYTVTGAPFAVERKATSGDISDAGMCFYTDVALKKDAVLEIRIPGVFGAPRKGVVRWSLRKYFSNFKVGISFDEVIDHGIPSDART